MNYMMAKMKFPAILMCAIGLIFTGCRSESDSGSAESVEDRSEKVQATESSGTTTTNEKTDGVQDSTGNDNIEQPEPGDRKPGVENEKNAEHQPVETQHAADSRPVVELSIHSAGDKPRHLLRYNLRQVTSAVYSGEIRQLTEAPHPVGAFEVIYRFKLRQTIGEPRTVDLSELDLVIDKDISSKESTKLVDPGDSRHREGFSVRYDLEDIKIEFPKRLEMETGILEQTLGRIFFTVLLTPRGLMTELEHAPSEDIRKSYMEDLSRSLPKLHPVYPLQPMGTGAVWEQTNAFTMQQDGGLARSLLKTNMSNRYTVVSVSEGKFGPAMELKVNTKINTKGTSSNMDVAGEGEGEGKTVVLLGTGLVSSYRNLVKVVTRVRDQKASNTTAVQLQLIALQ